MAHERHQGRSCLVYGHPERTCLFAACPAEVAINKVFDGEFGPIQGISVPYSADALDPKVRAQVQKTFIWGPIGEDRYIRHIGTDPDDWAGSHEPALG